MEGVEWGPIAALIATVCSGIAAIILATKGKNASGSDGSSVDQAKTVAVVAGSFADGKKIDALSKAISAVKDVMQEQGEQREKESEQAHRDARAVCDNMESLTRAMRENTESRRSSAAPPPDWTTLLALLDRRGGK